MVWTIRLFQLASIIVLLWLAGDVHFTNDRLVALLGSLAIIVAVIIVHELGHALALLAAGGRLKAFAVCGVKLTFDPLRVSMTAIGAGGEIGGLVTPDYENWPAARWQMVLFFSGGVMANALLACAALLLATQADRPPALSDAQIAELTQEAYWRYRETWQSYRQDTGLRHAIALFSGFLAVFNLIPAPGSDGDWLWRLLTTSPGNQPERDPLSEPAD